MPADDAEARGALDEWMSPHENVRRDARQAKYKADLRASNAQTAYMSALATKLGVTSLDLKFDTGIVCIVSKYASHCVFDMRTRWPCCVFCGGPLHELY